MARKRECYVVPQALRRKFRARTENGNYRGGQRREHSLWEAERLLKAALDELAWTEEQLLNARSVVPEKQAVAWLIKSHTAVTGRWIAEHLQMGHPENASRGINAFRRGETADIKKLKQRMSKCVGDP